jgi:hypothetical protein
MRLVLRGGVVIDAERYAEAEGYKKQKADDEFRKGPECRLVHTVIIYEQFDSRSCFAYFI